MGHSLRRLVDRHAAFAALALVAAIGPAADARAERFVRFFTNAGDFDIVLNPTNDPNLEVHVDNIVQYVNSGRYVDMVINRADEGFVIQMGGFTTDTSDPSEVGAFGTSPGFSSIESFPPVIVDADDDGVVDFPTLSNTVGTVSLALSGDPDSGTSSFFVNLTDNGFLDAQGFVPFAEVRDLTFFGAIDAETGEFGRQNLSVQVGAPGSLAFIEVPTFEDELIIVSQAVFIPEPNTAALVSLLGLAAVAAKRRPAA